MTKTTAPGVWKPELSEVDAPRYVAIADAIERDVRAGLLAPGSRLPTHRRLARELGVTVGTVSRGYAESERRGLTVGEVGRGTFVRSRTEAEGWAVVDASGSAAVNLSHSLPACRSADGAALAAALQEIARGDLTTALTRFHSDTGMARHREAAAEWLDWTGLTVSAGEVQLTAGVQHGLSVGMGALLDPGDVVLASELTYPGLMPLARMLGLKLRGVAMNQEGMDPDALHAACSSEPRPRAVYLVPTIQNPTARSLSTAGRDRIARLAERHDLLVFEDAVHALLPSEPESPLAARIPDRTVYLAGPSKSLVPGLRLGFLRAPPRHRDPIGTAIRTTLWMVPPLVAEVFRQWMDDGTAEHMLADKRDVIARRQEILCERLSGLPLETDPHAYHAWLPLPDPWRSDEFVAAARAAGVHVAGAGAFAVGRGTVPAAIRISIGLASEDRLASALETVRDLMSAEAGPSLTIV